MGRSDRMQILNLISIKLRDVWAKLEWECKCTFDCCLLNESVIVGLATNWNIFGFIAEAAYREKSPGTGARARWKDFYEPLHCRVVVCCSSEE